MSEPRWYQAEINGVIEALETGEDGLSWADARSRLAHYGYNELVIKGRTALERFLDQLRSPLVWILLIAAAVATILTTLHIEDMWVDTGVILGVVVLNVLLGFYQEGKADTALEALKRMAVPECKVIRNGEEALMPARELVPGDLVVLEGGDRVPADLRLILAKSVYADESALTGESAPVPKGTAAIRQANVAPADQTCIAHSGSFITRGSARGIVLTTGENTEFGKIARLMKQTEGVQTPLQRKVAAFTQVLIMGIMGLGLVNFATGAIFGQDLIYMFMASVALIVAGIPEMLPMIVTGILALSATAMARRNALIRKLPAAETLGCTTVICSDKTGTLTKNEMTVTLAYAGGKQYALSGVGYEPVGQIRRIGNAPQPAESGRDYDLEQLLLAGLLCNNASLTKDHGKYEIIGDPTEGALLVAAAKAGLTGGARRLDEIPFDSELMFMATLHALGEGNIIFAKGSPEKILEMCHSQLLEGRITPLNRQEIAENEQHLAGQALRVLGMAYKPVAGDMASLSQKNMKDLIFIGFQGMIDPPRPEAIEAVARCRDAGIRVVMVTGDHVLTAEAVAEQLGIAEKSGGGVLSGEQLFQMTDDDLFESVDRVSVYARVAPEHKLRIAQQLRRQGQVVAMTGDGVNDAPALRAADIGIAMGLTGTEVSKEAASMILTDDNFASIVAGVEEGRHAWKNLEKAILYTLPTNGGQMLLIMGAILLAPFIPLFAVRLPLEPIHILWINLADSVFLTVPLIFEPREKGLLTEAPRNPNENIANRLFFIRVGLVSLAMAATGFSMFWHYGHLAMSNEDVILTQAQTATFIAVQLLHVGFLVTARSIYTSAFSLDPFTNRWIIVGILSTLLTQIVIVYVPLVQQLFKTAAFPLEWWPVVLLALLPGFIVIEGEKLIRKLLKRDKTALNHH